MDADARMMITRAVIGTEVVVVLDLSTSEADQFASAVDDIREMIGIEQKYDVLVANFVELEQELAVRVLDQAYRPEHSPSKLFDSKLHFNRRVFNLLATARLYVDHAKHHISALFPREPEGRKKLEAAFAAEYDGYLAYRVMEGLRNYSQHRGLPIQGLTFGSRVIDQGKPNHRLEYNVAINIVVAELEGSKFKPSVLAELKALGNEVDAKPFLRQYVECLGRVHKALRTILVERIESSRAILKKRCDDFLVKAAPDDSIVGLALVRMHENSTYDVVKYYPRDQLTYLELLQRRNRSASNLARRIVTTQVLSR